MEHSSTETAEASSLWKATVRKYPKAIASSERAAIAKRPLFSISTEGKPVCTTPVDAQFAGYAGNFCHGLTLETGSGYRVVSSAAVPLSGSETLE